MTSVGPITPLRRDLARIAGGRSPSPPPTPKRAWAAMRASTSTMTTRATSIPFCRAYRPGLSFMLEARPLSATERCADEEIAAITPDISRCTVAPRPKAPPHIRMLPARLRPRPLAATPTHCLARGASSYFDTDNERATTDVNSFSAAPKYHYYGATLIPNAAFRAD